MKIAELKSGMLVRDGGKLLQVSTVYDNYVTVTVLLEGRPMTAPARTAVRRYCAEDVELLFDPPTTGQMRRMDEVYSTTR
jgi:hypothetical protein